MAKRLSYIEDARCLKVKIHSYSSFCTLCFGLGMHVACTVSKETPGSIFKAHHKGNKLLQNFHTHFQTTWCHDPSNHDLELVIADFVKYGWQRRSWLCLQCQLKLTLQNVARINNKIYRNAASLRYVVFECPTRHCIFLLCVRVVYLSLSPRMSNVDLKQTKTSSHTLPSSQFIFSSISLDDNYHHYHHHYVVCLTIAP